MNDQNPHQPNLTDTPSPEDLQWLRERLHSVSEVTPSADLTHRVMTAVKREQIRESRMRWFHRTAAAVVLVGLSAWGISSWKPQRDAAVITSIETKESGVQEALDWFCRSQESNGSWNPARWGGDPRFEVALSALPLLAMSSAEGERSPHQQEASVKAREYLLRHCDERGRFGPAFYGSSYTQGISTLALLASYQQKPDARLKGVLQRALDVIISQQQPSGGWSVAEAAQPDLTVTLWQREALQLAARLGWEDVLPHISLATKWLNSHAKDLPDRDALAPAEHIDFFSLYVATTRLRESTSESAHDQLTSIKKILLEKQVQQGEDSGSWSPDDRWASVGGRLYSTAMASLALR
jgi:hypothetical protein